MLVSLAVRIGCGVNLQAFPHCSCLWGMVLRFPLGLPLTPAHNALRSVLLSLVANLGELRLRSKVLIRTGLGTMAVLVGSVVVAVILRNYLGVVIGTWHILADLYWLVCDDI